MLQQDRVAERQVRAGEPGDLVVGEVPRHDPEQRPEGAAADDRGPVTEDVERLVAGELLGIVAVVLEDVRGEIDLAERTLADLAHLGDDQVGEFLTAFAVQFGRPLQQRSALGWGRG